MFVWEWWWICGHVLILNRHFSPRSSSFASNDFHLHIYQHETIIKLLRQDNKGKNHNRHRHYPGHVLSVAHLSHNFHFTIGISNYEYKHTTNYHTIVLSIVGVDEIMFAVSGNGWIIITQNELYASIDNHRLYYNGVTLHTGENRFGARISRVIILKLFFEKNIIYCELWWLLKNVTFHCAIKSAISDNEQIFSVRIIGWKWLRTGISFFYSLKKETVLNVKCTGDSNGFTKIKIMQ